MHEHTQLIQWTGEAMRAGARLLSACQEVGLSLSTWRRRNGQAEDRRPTAARPVPASKLTAEEERQIIAVCNEPEYASLPPAQIVPRLADKGIYLASESTFYRVLRRHGQVHHRGRYFYLYLTEDIFSRKIVGYEVHEEENGEQAAALLHRTVLREGCYRHPLVLHADNGAPMKSRTLKAKLEELNITGPHSRPRVSNDNPYVESLFRTLKYVPAWPSSGFLDLDEARRWVGAFRQWYNEEHRHSAIGYVTPDQRHRGEDISLLAKRKAAQKSPTGTVVSLMPSMAASRGSDAESGEARNRAENGRIKTNNGVNFVDSYRELCTAEQEKSATSGGSRKSSALFISLPEHMKATYRRAKTITLIVDNYIIYKSQQTLKWLKQNPKFRVIYQPVYSPWVNHVERLWQAPHDTITRNHQCRAMWQLLKKGRHFMETVSPFPGGKHGQTKV